MMRKMFEGKCYDVNYNMILQQVYGKKTIYESFILWNLIPEKFKE